MKKILKNLENIILDFIFPKKCISCKKDGFYLCPECFLKCPSPENDLPFWIFSLKSYKNKEIRKIIWLLKYRGNFDISNNLADFLYDFIIEELNDLKTFYNFQNPIFTSVPSHPKDFKKRGFNQSEKLALALVNKDSNFKYLRLLKKIRRTKHQAKIKNKIERIKNIKDAFVPLDSKIIKGKNIIIIDDIVTTGATLKEMKKVLKANGARQVFAFTFAH